MTQTPIDRSQLHELLTDARDSVRILGIVPLDLDWEKLIERWSAGGTSRNFTLTLLCESDNFLFSQSFILDTDAAPHRQSFRELLFIRDRAIQLLADAPFTVDVKILHVGIPTSTVEIDSALFAATALYSQMSQLVAVDRSSPWGTTLREYTNLLFGPTGRKCASVQGDEVLELFDHNRIPRGIFPRHSFYDTDYSQLVVWALIFDRNGRMLIHRRADNAKDNRGMWDKSVGGHADFSIDVDTSRAVVREVVEELFSDEMKTHSEFAAWTVSDADVIYLGEWRPDKRRNAPFREVVAFKKEWAFFRLKDSSALYSPRTLPDHGLRRLRVIADVYLFIAGTGLMVESLKNSEFKLMELTELKSLMDRSLRGEETPDFDVTHRIPLFTPDLVNILTGGLRDILEDFSLHIKRYCR